AVRRSRHGVDTGGAKIGCRLVPHLALTEVQTHREGIACGVADWKRLQRLAHPPVKQRAPKREEAIVHNRFKAVVGEVEPAPDSMEHTTPDQLLAPLRR